MNMSNAPGRLAQGRLNTSVMTVFGLGALGGFLPVLASAASIDLSPIIDHPTLTVGNYVGYVIKVTALVILGGIIASLNREVRQPIALVQLGMAAPALITAYINGSSPARPVHASISFISPALADETTAGKSFRLAGGWLADVNSGIFTRLDTLNEINRMRDANAIYPPTRSTLSPVDGGDFCTTPQGRFGPGPTNPLGAPCTVPTPSGSLTTGVVTK
jgi:hypothetical protein